MRWEVCRRRESRASGRREREGAGREVRARTAHLETEPEEGREGEGRGGPGPMRRGGPRTVGRSYDLGSRHTKSYCKCVSVFRKKGHSGFRSQEHWVRNTPRTCRHAP